MQYPLSERIHDHGPTAFPAQLLATHSALFAERSALSFTPTENLPKHVVGTGRLDVFLPVCTPDFYECFFIRSYMSPRLWVDLLQRHTGFIRWTPASRAAVTITRCDTSVIRDDHFIAGTKALLDALKVQTSGRRDGQRLYYFGAIRDDSRPYVTVSYKQAVDPRGFKIGMRVTSQATAEA